MKKENKLESYQNIFYNLHGKFKKQKNKNIELIILLKI